MIDAVRSSASIRQVLVALGLNPTGANYRSVHDAVARLRLDTSHWTGQGYLRGKSHNYSTRVPLSEICVPNSTYRNTSFLKRRLVGGLENLRLLCPNCNSLQPTFAGRNKALLFKGPRRRQTMQAVYTRNRKDKRTPEMRRAEYERAKKRRSDAEAAG